MCHHMWAHWRHLANMIELVLPSAHPSPEPKLLIPWASLSPQSKWHRDRFSHFRTGDRSVSLYFTMGHSFPPKLPLPMVGSGLPSKTWFPGSTQIFNPNGISIGSAVFARLTSVTDRLTSRLVFTADCTPRSECCQFGMPAERRAQFQTCPDPEFPNALHSEFMNTANVKFLNVPLCTVPMSYLAGSKWGRPLCYGHAAAHSCLQRALGACGRRIALDEGVASILALWR